MASPRTCSGLAYSGVIGPARVVRAPCARSRILAMPKSRSFGEPSLITRMLLGLRSRWMTSR